MGIGEATGGIYGFVVFAVLLLIGISMLSNVVGNAHIDNTTSTGKTADSVFKNIDAGYGLLAVGCICAVTLVLKVLNYW